MRISKLQINGSNPKEQLTDFLKLEYRGSYFCEQQDTLVLITEEYSFTTNSSFTITVIVYAGAGNTVQVDLISGGTGIGFINFDWWKGRRALKRVYSRISKYCLNNGLQISEFNVVTKQLV